MAVCHRLVDPEQEVMCSLAHGSHLFCYPTPVVTTKLAVVLRWEKQVAEKQLLTVVCVFNLPHHQEILEKKTQWLSLSRWFLKFLFSYAQRTHGVNTFRTSPDKMESWGLSNMQQMQRVNSPGDCWREAAVTCYLKEGKYWLRAAALRHSSSIRTRHVIRKLYLFLSSSSVI